MVNPASFVASARIRSIAYTGAAASHLAVGDGAGALGPIGFAVIALAPWQTGSVR
jgi:hypothetical protein